MRKEIQVVAVDLTLTFQIEFVGHFGVVSVVDGAGLLLTLSKVNGVSEKTRKISITSSNRKCHPLRQK